MQNYKILGLGAHPDDLELMAGGTLAKYVRAGHKVTMASLTNGNMGHKIITPEELARVRKKEMEASTKVIGADMEWIGFPDEFLFCENKETRLKVTDVIRKANPDIIITHSPTDYHPDHRAAYHLVFAASFLATVPHIKTAHPAIEKVPIIYCMDTLGGFGFQPDVFIDITDTFQIKREALSKHQSQIKWMKEHDNIDFIDWMRVIAEFRGLQSGVKYAEAYSLEKRWPAVPAANAFIPFSNY